MKVIFVAGPFRAPTPYEIELNVRRAEALALQIWKLGAVALCPHANTRYFQNSAPDALWLHGALEMLRRCDAVMMVAGWRQSEGARAEVQEAAKRGIPVFVDFADLAKWLSA